MNFLKAAILILEAAQKPLHYREITQQALDANLINSEGKTPWATMNARLSMDIVNKGKSSDFIRVQPGFFALNNNKNVIVTEHLSMGYSVSLPHINNQLTAKQKGDIGEARVAELITLYGNEGLTCYRPISDDEGIDLIVKRRGELEVVFIQIKTSYGYGFGNGDRGFVSTIKESRLDNRARHLLVFTHFDYSKGDLFDQVFCITSTDFLKLTKNEARKNGHRVFTVGLNHPERSRYAEFMIEKRELANRIIEIMDRLN